MLGDLPDLVVRSQDAALATQQRKDAGLESPPAKGSGAAVEEIPMTSREAWAEVEAILTIRRRNMRPPEGRAAPPAGLEVQARLLAAQVLPKTTRASGPAPPGCLEHPFPPSAVCPSSHLDVTLPQQGQ